MAAKKSKRKIGRGVLPNGRSKHEHAKNNGYVPLYRYVVQSAHWIALTPPAAKLLCVLMTLHNGTNNQYIELGRRLAAAYTGMSRSVVDRAFVELEEAGFIETTKKSAFYTKKQAAFYRLTFEPVREGRSQPVKKQPTNDFLAPEREELGRTGARKSKVSPSSGTIPDPTVPPAGHRNCHNAYTVPLEGLLAPFDAPNRPAGGTISLRHSCAGADPCSGIDPDRAPESGRLH